MTTTRLTWRCEICGDPIANRCGYIHAIYSEIDQYDTEMQAWDEEVKTKFLADENGVRITWASELEDLPTAARWHVHHFRCDPNPDSHDYAIGVERVRTYKELTSWTAHLLGKKWFGSTDWERLLRRALTPSTDA